MKEKKVMKKQVTQRREAEEIRQSEWQLLNQAYLSRPTRPPATSLLAELAEF